MSSIGYRSFSQPKSLTDSRLCFGGSTAWLNSNPPSTPSAGPSSRPRWRPHTPHRSLSKKAKKEEERQKGSKKQAPGPAENALVDAKPAGKDNVASSPVLPLGGGAGEPPTSGVSRPVLQKMIALSQSTALLNTYSFKAKPTPCLGVLDRHSKWLFVDLGQLRNGPEYSVSHTLLRKAGDLLICEYCSL